MMSLFDPFHGRINRLQWWLLQFAIFGIAIAGMITTIFLFADKNSPEGSRTTGEMISLGFVFCLMIYMNFSTCLNRLRDTGRSGFWYLTFLLPTAGTGLMVYFCGIERGKGSSPSIWTSVHPEPVPQDQHTPRTTANGPRREFGRRAAGTQSR